MNERRYSDEEVAEIFARASETELATRRQLKSASEGLTLGELQQIGKEAGLEPELVAQAAQSLNQPAQPSTPVFLGLPIGAARTVRLERRMTDTEWEQLVVQLRETFQARGVVRAEGSLRQWSNGNLQVLLEPDGDSQRVRFRTVRGQARPFMMIGLGMIGVSAVTFLSAVIAGGVPMTDALERTISMVLVGGGFFAAGAFPLRRWARTRQEQMEELAGRLQATIGAGDSRGDT